MARIVAIPQPVIAEVAQRRDRRGLPARRRLRSRGRLDGSDVRDAGRSHRALLQHADGGAHARDRAQARDGDAAHRRNRSTRRRRLRGVSSIASSPPDRLHAETLALAGKIASASRGVVGIGKAAFYAQIELDKTAAYAYAKEVMTANALGPPMRAKASPHFSKSVRRNGRIEIGEG